MCKVGPSHLILSSFPPPPPVPGEFQGTSVLAIQLLPCGKGAIKWAAGLPLKMVVHSQDSEHLVAIIDTCDHPPARRRRAAGNRQQARGPGSEFNNLVCSHCFCFFLGLWALHSAAVCHHSLLSFTFASLLKLSPLLLWTHCVIKISACKC